MWKQQNREQKSFNKMKNIRREKSMIEKSLVACRVHHHHRVRQQTAHGVVHHPTEIVPSEIHPVDQVKVVLKLRWLKLTRQDRLVARERENESHIVHTWWTDIQHNVDMCVSFCYERHVFENRHIHWRRRGWRKGRRRDNRESDDRDVKVERSCLDGRRTRREIRVCCPHVIWDNLWRRRERIFKCDVISCTSCIYLVFIIEDSGTREGNVLSIFVHTEVARTFEDCCRWITCEDIEMSVEDRSSCVILNATQNRDFKLWEARKSKRSNEKEDSKTFWHRHKNNKKYSKC